MTGGMVGGTNMSACDIFVAAVVLLLLVGMIVVATELWQLHDWDDWDD